MIRHVTFGYVISWWACYLLRLLWMPSAMLLFFPLWSSRSCGLQSEESDLVGFNN